MTLRVMLADDHEMFREALRMFLEVQGDIEVVSEVTDGHGVLRELGQSHLDVVCMDIGMHGLDGIDTTRRALAIAPHLKVIACRPMSNCPWSRQCSMPVLWATWSRVVPPWSCFQPFGW